MTGRVLTSERVVLGASALTLALAVASWVLMRFGAYTLGRAVALSVLTGALLALAARRLGSRAPAPQEPWRWLALAGVLCLSFGVLYAAYPTYFMLGGQDPGPYLAFGARIAKTGGLDLRVPEFQRWAREHGPGLYRSFPAVYGDMGSAEPDALHPQFVHLYTAYMANFWAAFGVEGAVRANAWVAVLCLATGFVFLRRLGSLPAAFAFVLALGLSPAFIWASRITMTEVVALWLNVGGLLLLLLAWELESFLFGVFAAAVLGAGVLNRLDGGLGAFAILGFSAAAMLEAARKRRMAAVCALVHAAVIAFGYVDGARLAPDYFRDLNRVSGGTVYKLIELTLGLDLFACGLALAPLNRKAPQLVNETTVRMGGYALLVFLAVWVAFGFTLRPFNGDPESATILFELTWYVSFVAWPLCLLGFGAALGNARFQRSLPLIVYAVGALFIYTSRTDVAHEHIWASRRWVPHVIPFVLAGATLGVPHALDGVRRLGARFGTRAARAAVALGASALAAAAFLPFLDFASPFLGRSMLHGLPAAYERAATYARMHRDRWPLVTGSVQLGSILTYAYGVPTVVLTERGLEQVEKGAYVGEIGIGLDPFDLRNSLGVDAKYAGQYLERKESEPPRRLVTLRVPLEGGVFGPPDFDLEVAAAHPAFRTPAERRPDGTLVAGDHRATLLRGPGINLPAGRYRVELYGSTAPGKRKRRGIFDVVDDEQFDAIVDMVLEGSNVRGERLLGGLDFTLPKTTRGVDFRVRVEPDSGLRLARLRFKRLGS
jgi:hypothetical protein